MPAYSGTFVTSDHEALIGILALESQRAGAWLVGEDLGTVEQWVQDYLLSRGVLGTTIMWFERDYARPPRRARCSRSSGAANCLASVTVHDLPPTAGYLAGEHVRIRADLGLLTRPAEEELAESNAQVAEWRAMCVERGWMPEPTGLTRTWSSPCTALVAASPSVLVGVALTDAVGDRRAQNQPGTDKEYPNWRVPLTDARGSGRADRGLPEPRPCSAGCGGGASRRVPRARYPAQASRAWQRSEPLDSVTSLGEDPAQAARAGHRWPRGTRW